MPSTDLAAAILRLCSHRHNMPVADFYQSFPTVDRTTLEEMVHELAEDGLLVASVGRAETIDRPPIIINSISRTTLVGEAWLAQLPPDPTDTIY